MNNDLTLLDNQLKKQRPAAPNQLKPSEYFEYFVCEQVLKDSDVDSEDILEGRIGGGQDGGVDGLFTMLDGALVETDTDISKARRGAKLSIHIVQAKVSETFEETPLIKIADTLDAILDLGRDEKLKDRSICSEKLHERAEIARSAILGLGTSLEHIDVHVYYATRGDAGKVSAGVHGRAKDLMDRVSKALSNISASVSFLGASELLKLARLEPLQTVNLSFVGSSLPDRDNSYVVLVTLPEYFAFLSKDPTLRSYMYEGNVRDYQGQVEVNKSIRASLEDPASPQFWWLNNGVTLLCSRINGIGRVLALDNPQIVNGLQTSVVLFDYFQEVKDAAVKAHANSLLLVRAIATEELKVRDRIIRSTNNQTKVTEASLHATDDFQRGIEEYFVSKGWFYDRRKNSYRNRGKPVERIVSIPYLAQAVMAILLMDPATARARPSTIFKDDQYKRVFDDALPLEVYLWAARTQKAADEFLRSEVANATPEERSNLRFYLSMMVAAKLIGARLRAPIQASKFVEKGFTVEEMRDAIKLVRAAVEERMKGSGLSMDRVAKASELKDECLKLINL